MELKEYQQHAMRTRGDFKDRLDQLVFAALEVTAESGEVANVVYKEAYQGHPHDRAHLVEEIGDVLWGLACLCDALHITLDEVAYANILKLRRRYRKGFSPAASIARVDHAPEAERFQTLVDVVETTGTPVAPASLGPVLENVIQELTPEELARRMATRAATFYGRE